MNEARRPLIAGNWKMNGLMGSGIALARDIAGRRANRDPGSDLVLCPPATLIRTVIEAVAGRTIAVGGQDCHAETSGAHTGDIAAVMLADLGCRYVIVGHSERRQDHGETSEQVRAKVAAAVAAGLTAILCVGESAAERDSGVALGVVARQLGASLPEAAPAAQIVVAYEPVWAIGTGRTPTQPEIQEMHAHIRDLLGRAIPDGLGARILYGGSVKPDNARLILGLPDVDGALVGGASLKAADFWSIAQSCR
jgi:triosephosphate isomerase (TIM)